MEVNSDRKDLLEDTVDKIKVIDKVYKCISCRYMQNWLALIGVKLRWKTEMSVIVPL